MLSQDRWMERRTKWLAVSVSLKFLSHWNFLSVFNSEMHAKHFVSYLLVMWVSLGSKQNVG
jgi:hypothetical protein